MSTLTITYAGMTLFDGEVSAFRWDDVPGQSVTVTGQMAKPKTANTGGLSAIADLIAQASKAKTTEKRRELTQTQTETLPETAEDNADE